MGQELVLEEELDMSSTAESAPMGPCTVGEVEEGNVGDTTQLLLE